MGDARSWVGFRLKTAHRTGRLDLSVPAGPGTAVRFRAFPAFVLDASKGTYSEVSLQNHRIRAIPPSISGIASALRVLDLSNNRLRVADDLAPLERLRSLRLSGNEIRAMPPALSRLRALEELYADGNEIAAIPPACLHAWKRLRVLSLSRNLLDAVPKAIGALPALCVLHLDGNRLRTLPDEVADLRLSLRVLTAGENPILQLPPCVAALDRLATLRLPAPLVASDEDAAALVAVTAAGVSVASGAGDAVVARDSASIAAPSARALLAKRAAAAAAAPADGARRKGGLRQTPV